MNWGNEQAVADVDLSHMVSAMRRIEVGFAIIAATAALAACGERLRESGGDNGMEAMMNGIIAPPGEDLNTITEGLTGGGVSGGAVVFGTANSTGNTATGPEPDTAGGHATQTPTGPQR